MNIFYLDHCEHRAAAYMHDKHVVKMVLETAQILCTVYHRFGWGEFAAYKPTHENHPSVRWAGDHARHYEWLHRHGIALCGEYTFRFKKLHASEKVIRPLFATHANMNTRSVLVRLPPQCMPDEYKDSANTVLAYRNYYLGAKVVGNNWTRRARPNFVIEGELKMAKKKATVAETMAEAPEQAAPAEVAPAMAGPRGPRGVVGTAIITLIAETNPKRAGSKAHAMFEHYVSGMTVDAFIESVGAGATATLVYDTAHSFISIEGYEPGKVVEKKVRAVKAPKEKKVKVTKAALPVDTELDDLVSEEA